MSKLVYTLFFSLFIFSSGLSAGTIQIPANGSPVRIEIDNRYSKQATFNYKTNGQAVVLLRVIQKIGGGFTGKIRRTHRLGKGNTNTSERLHGGRYIATVEIQSGNATTVLLTGPFKYR